MRAVKPDPCISLGDLFDRNPLAAPSQEMSLLGSILLDPRTIDDITAFIRGPECFVSERHAAIFDAMSKLYERTRTIDLSQLSDSLRATGMLEEIGGPDYLVELAGSVPSAANAVHYARAVASVATLRALTRVCGETLHACAHGDHTDSERLAELLDTAEAKMYAVSDRRSAQRSITDIADLMTAELDRADRAAQNQGEMSGLRTGYYDLDEMLCGLQSSEMIVIAARPSMGKTAFMLDIARQVAQSNGIGVGVFSLEMTASSLAQRLLCSQSGVDSNKLRRGHLGSDDFRSLALAAGTIAELMIHIDDTPSMTIMQLRAAARRLASRHGLGLIVIDYLQLLTSPAHGRENRQVEVAAISRGIKALARELKIPVIVLAQLNRQAEGREGHRPRMSDLRESGSIEQDADVVMLLHREEYYHAAEPDWKASNPDKVGIAELIIAKQRNGPTGIVELAWNAASTSFRNKAHINRAYETRGQEQELPI